MNRQKSNRTLLIEQERALRKAERQLKREEKERDRAIRKERRELKRQEREAKRQARLKKRLTHESVVKNGVPKIRSGGMELGIHDAIPYSPLMWCESCDCIVREREMIGDICSICHFEIEGRVNDDKYEGLKAQGDKVLPGKGEREEKVDALAGRLILT